MKTEKQRKRLEMLGDNLVMLHYGMRKENMLKDPEKSVFFRTDDAYKSFIAGTEFALSLYRNSGHRDLTAALSRLVQGRRREPPDGNPCGRHSPRMAAGTVPPAVDEQTSRTRPGGTRAWPIGSGSWARGSR